jgi:preprotein translocase subunit SecG
MGSSILTWIFTVLLILTSLFMILLVLIQRGRGGGLAGAFGGMGGQSAFGTRAGDVFTKITVVVAIVFILLSALLGMSMRANHASSGTGAFDPAAVDNEDAPAVSAGNDAETGTEGDSDAAIDFTDGTPDAGASDAAAGDAEGTDAETPAEEPSTPEASDEEAAAEEPAEGESEESSE